MLNVNSKSNMKYKNKKGKSKMENEKFKIKLYNEENEDLYYLLLLDKSQIALLQWLLKKSIINGSEWKWSVRTEPTYEEIK